MERNKEKIIGSIRYAQTIQTAALPTEPDLNYYFNSFVVYHPKDIVSGDFYWYHREVDTEKKRTYSASSTAQDTACRARS